MGTVLVTGTSSCTVGEIVVTILLAQNISCTNVQTRLVFILTLVLAALLFIWPDNRAGVRTTMIKAWTSIRAVLVAWAVALTGLLLLFASIHAVLITVTSNRTVVGIIKTWLDTLFDNFFVFDQTVWIRLPS